MLSSSGNSLGGTPFVFVFKLIPLMSELTCRVLPGAHAREYTCHAHVPWMSHLDVVYAAIACLLYVGVMVRKKHLLRDLAEIDIQMHNSHALFYIGQERYVSGFG